MGSHSGPMINQYSFAVAMKTPARKIIHIDMDAFFASVEQRDFPELRGKPVIVGGPPHKRGVVAAASYEARQFGIHSAMPSSQAYQRCPQAIFTRARFEVYREVSNQIRAIFNQYTHLVEPLSLDEAYLDVTTNRANNPSATLLAQEIRRKIFKTTGLTASAGVAANKFLAKIASDINKPNGIFVIPPAKAMAFVEGLSIGKFHGIGKATEKKMHQLGIFSGLDLKGRKEAELIEHFGKVGSYYYLIARGIDNRQVSPDRIRKSVGVEETFSRDLMARKEMEEVLKRQAKELEQRLEKSKVAGKTVTLKLRYSNFDTHTRSQTLSRYLQEARAIYRIAKKHLRQSDATKRPIRLLGITVSNLNNQQDRETERQLWLPFGDDFLF